MDKKHMFNTIGIAAVVIGALLWGLAIGVYAEDAPAKGRYRCPTKTCFVYRDVGEFVVEESGVLFEDVVLEFNDFRWYYVRSRFLWFWKRTSPDLQIVARIDGAATGVKYFLVSEWELVQ